MNIEEKIYDGICYYLTHKAAKVIAVYSKGEFEEFVDLGNHLQGLCRGSNYDLFRQEIHLNDNEVLFVYSVLNREWECQWSVAVKTVGL